MIRHDVVVFRKKACFWFEVGNLKMDKCIFALMEIKEREVLCFRVKKKKKSLTGWDVEGQSVEYRE